VIPHPHVVTTRWMVLVHPLDLGLIKPTTTTTTTTTTTRLNKS
jgi:hypothetical protein